MVKPKNRGNGTKKAGAGAGFLTGKQTAAALAIAILFFATFFLDTWTGVQCLRCGYEIVNAQMRHEKFIDLQKKLVIEQSRLRSPVLLAKKAKIDFGLVTPEPSQIIVIP
ncbi:MAG: hypothetical protein GXP53_03115 [Deltaproteobacteria bacterium]|nr:hypothetical protein [Deltaproteobacteria bacterium]